MTRKVNQTVARRTLGSNDEATKTGRDLELDGNLLGETTQQLTLGEGDLILRVLALAFDDESRSLPRSTRIDGNVGVTLLEQGEHFSQSRRFRLTRVGEGAASSSDGESGRRRSVDVNLGHGELNSFGEHVGLDQTVAVFSEPGGRRGTRTSRGRAGSAERVLLDPRGSSSSRTPSGTSLLGTSGRTQARERRFVRHVDGLGLSGSERRGSGVRVEVGGRRERVFGQGGTGEGGERIFTED